jgi:hypothetical protein
MEVRDEETQVPTLSAKALVTGMVTMHVVNLVLYFSLISFVPLAILLVGGISHSDIFKARILFVLAIFVGVSLSLNVVVIGRWALRRLVQREPSWRKISALLAILILAIILRTWGLSNDFAVILLAAGLFFTSWDRAFPRRAA